MATKQAKIHQDRVIQRLLEVYRKAQYRTTVSGRRVRWDEPGEEDTPEVRFHNAKLAQRSNQRKDSKERLKAKGIVPTKQGKPIFEREYVLDESINSLLVALRRMYHSNQRLTLREWIHALIELMENE